MDSVNTFREELGISWRIAALRLRGQMEYRSSFMMQIAGSFIINFSELVVLFALFNRFDSLGGWSLHEVIFLHAVSQITFSVADTISNGHPDCSRSDPGGRIRSRARAPGFFLPASDR